MSDSMRPHRRLPTRLPHPWDSLGKNTGVGCHVLLQCMKVKSESEVAQSCLTLSNPMDCSLPGSSAHGIFQARVLEWVAIAFSDNLIRPKHLESMKIFLGGLFICLYALSMVMKHSKFLTNIDVYTNFNPEIWRQSSTQKFGDKVLPLLGQSRDVNSP